MLQCTVESGWTLLWEEGIQTILLEWVAKE